MNIQKIRTAIDEDYAGFCEDCFAHWITCLWGKYRDDFTFEENKEAFFYLLERLLREGRVAFSPPEDPLCRQHMRWKAPPEEVIAFLKRGWPTEAKDEYDSAINDYFYDLERCPSTAWLGDDDQWHGS